MSLGLDELTDDQLMELLNEACIELAVRDPIVRKLAQGCIRDMGALLPEIRRRIKETVEEINEEELEESDTPRRGRGKRHGKNPGTGGFSQGGFTVPQNPLRTPNPSPPPPSSTWKTVSIFAPVGYHDIESKLQDLLDRHTNRSVMISRTGSPHIYRALLNDTEIATCRASSMFAPFQLIVL